MNPLKMPGEYAAIGKPQGPQDWKVTDVIATASLIGGIFGKGGGRELDSALLLQDARKRFGRRGGKRVWADLRTAEDPEAPVTVQGRAVPVPRRSRASCAEAVPRLPDRNSLKRLEVSDDAEAASGSVGQPRGPGTRRHARRLPATAARTRCSCRRASRSQASRWRCSDRRRPTSLRSSCSTWTCTGPGSTRAAPRSPGSACTCCSGAAATTPGAPPRRARTSSTRSRSRSASPTGRGRRSTRCTTASAGSACRSTCSRRPTTGRRARPTTPHPGRRRSTPSARTSAWSPHGRRSAAGPWPTRASAPPTSTRPIRRSVSSS